MINKQDKPEAIDQQSLVEDLAVNQDREAEVRGGTTQLGKLKYEDIPVDDIRL